MFCFIYIFIFILWFFDSILCNFRGKLLCSMNSSPEKNHNSLEQNINLMSKKASRRNATGLACDFDKKTLFVCCRSIWSPNNLDTVGVGHIDMTLT